ncbi:hypothetical protein Q8A67_001110 [Cirrhinus molitorella]|uniref:Uncharacterized protein n=1 Tax=Cirrhinus molitorella TaxID=172907 RepID=A0AA88U7B5_9TELE|nr:hypothetical protein Q8A67_001110 [Cirrhinus molitorella]
MEGKSGGLRRGTDGGKRVSVLCLCACETDRHTQKHRSVACGCEGGVKWLSLVRTQQAFNASRPNRRVLTKNLHFTTTTHGRCFRLALQLHLGARRKSNKHRKDAPHASPTAYNNPWAHLTAP